MKKVPKLLARFALFSAAACAILFGLPALATHHPFILLMELDAVAICGDCTEYGEGACCSFDDLINDKGYAYPIEDYKADNDIETDDEFDQDDYIVALVKKLEQRTTVLHVSNGNYIIFV